MVSPGRITLALGWLTRLAVVMSKVEHTDPTVTLLVANPGWPWANTGVILHDGKVTAVAVTWFGARKRLRTALASAGFSVRSNQPRSPCQIATSFLPRRRAHAHVDSRGYFSDRPRGAPFTPRER